MHSTIYYCLNETLERQTSLKARAYKHLQILPSTTAGTWISCISSLHTFMHDLLYLLPACHFFLVCAIFMLLHRGITPHIETGMTIARVVEQ